jgi:hypothetical protein
MSAHWGVLLSTDWAVRGLEGFVSAQWDCSMSLDTKLTCRAGEDSLT